MRTDAPTSAPARAASPAGMLAGLVRSLRPKQWTKNVFLFAGLVFAKRLGDPKAVATAWAAFGIFCALSAAGYLLNDLLDAPRDRVHPRKAQRPIASGLVSPWLAGAAAAVLTGGGLVAAWQISQAFWWISLGYLAVTISYSLAFKHLLLVDVIALAAAYVVRAAAGAIAISVEVSPWLLLCTTLLALFIGIAKRRHELVMLEGAAGEHRAALDHYSVALLDQMLSLVSSATLIAYALYTFFADHARRDVMLVATFPFVVYGLFRYLYLVYKRGEGGSPEELVLSDWPLLVDVALWGLTVVAILYWR